ncbi:MAG: InlB B-repeat-containing protein [Firmicutes bacterium]|nr:InlB B-repeat-containing protein [Bacillota bacterium]
MKNKGKKILCTLLMLCMVAVMTPTVAFAAGPCGDCGAVGKCIDSVDELQSAFDAETASVTGADGTYTVTFNKDFVGRIHLHIEDATTNITINTNGKKLTGHDGTEALCIDHVFNGAQNVTLTGSGALSSSATHTIYVGIGGTLTVDGPTIINTATGGISINGTATLEGQYSTITFDANGGAGAMVVTRPNGEYTLPECDFTAPAGKVFAGWAESEDGAVISGTYNLSANDTLYAIWADDSDLTGTVTITGDAKYGSTLTANVENSNHTGELQYQWVRDASNSITGANGQTYTILLENNIGSTLKVVVTSSGQTGSIESDPTAIVTKGDNLNVPTGLVGVAPTTDGGNDGKITGTTTAMEWSKYRDFHSTEGACSDEQTQVGNPGTYYVRYRPTSTYNAGSNYATVVVPDYEEQATEYDIWVGGERVTSDNLVIDSTDNVYITAGSATYDSVNNILTLDGFNYTEAGYPDSGANGVIYATDDLTINLVNNNTIKNTENRDGSSWNCGIYVSSGNLTIIGSGDLTVTGGGGFTSHGISVGGSLTINGTGTVNANAAEAQGTSGIYASAGTTVNSGIVNAQGAAASSEDSRGIEGTLTINGGTVTAKADTAEEDSYGVEGSVTVNNGTLTAQGNTAALSAVPTLEAGITAQASESYDGSEASEYTTGQVSGFKWFQTSGQATTYTVSFNANGGSGSIASVSGLESGAEYTLPACTFAAPAGKVFKAWDVNGTEKAPGDKITVTADTTVKAIWKTKTSSSTWIPTVPAAPEDPLKPDRAEANEAIGAEAAKDAADYTDIADQIKAVTEEAAAKIAAAKTVEEIQAAEEAAKAEIQKIQLTYDVDETGLAARSKQVTLKSGKKAILVTWYDKAGRDIDFEGYEIFRSTKKNTGYGDEPFFETTREKYYNTAIKTGERYYYRVRGYVTVDGERVYTELSTRAYRTVK